MIDLLIEPGTWRGFLTLWGALYLVLLGIYFGLGSILVLISKRHPERQIQTVKRSSRDLKDIRQSLVALTSISFYVSFGIFAQASGWTLLAAVDTTVLSFIGFLVLSFLLYDTWFYWGHRALHTPLLYRFHELHHRSITPTTWSNNNDSFVGATIEQGYFLVLPFVLPVPPEVIIVHKLYDQVTGMISHCGFEYFAGKGARAPWPGLCTVFHDQHHSNFRCNYGNTFSLWDRLCGTMHPKYDDRVLYFENVSTEDKGADSVVSK